LIAADAAGYSTLDLPRRVLDVAMAHSDGHHAVLFGWLHPCRIASSR